MRGLLSLLLLLPAFAFADPTSPAGTTYRQVLDEGSAVTRREKLNFTGTGVNCVDNAGSKRTDCTITSGGGGGASSLEVYSNQDATRSSPTATIGVGVGLKTTVVGSSFTFRVDFSSVASRSDLSSAVGGYALEPATVTPRFNKGIDIAQIRISTFNVNVGNGPYVFVSSVTSGQQFGVAVSSNSLLQGIAGVYFTPGNSPIVDLYAGDSDSSVRISSLAAQINSRRQLRLGDSDNSNYAGFVAPTVLSTNLIWRLPTADGSGCLSSDGSGNLSITTCGSGGSGSSVVSSYGAIYLSSSASSSSSLTGTPSRLTIFNSNGISYLTTPDHTLDQILVSTTGVFDVGAILISTGSNGIGTKWWYQIAVNGVNTSITCTDTTGTGCKMSGVLSITAGSTVTVNASANVSGSIVHYMDAQLVVSAAGGAGGGSGSSSGGSALTVSTGSVTSYQYPPVTTAATAIIFDSATFTSRLMSGTSAYVSLNLGSSNGTIFAMTTSSSVTNSTSETDVVGTGQGTRTLPANYLQPGKTLRLKASGIYSTNSTSPGVLTFKFKLGSTVIVSTASLPLVASQTNQLWSFGVALTVRSAGSSGTVFANTSFGMFDSTNSFRTFPMTMTGATTVDTTVSQLVSITAQFGTASSNNSLTTTNFVVVGETVTTVGGVSGGSTSPGGSAGSIQYNNGTTFAGDTNFQYDSSVSSVSLAGKLEMDRPSVSAGAFAARSAWNFDPSSTDPTMATRSYNVAAPNHYWNVYDYLGNNPGGLNFALGNGSSFSVKVASCTTCIPSSAYVLTGNTGRHQILATQGPNIGSALVQFDSVGNSSFTIPVVISTLTVSRIQWSNGTVQVSSPSASGSGSSYTTKVEKLSAPSGVCSQTLGCTNGNQYQTSTSSRNYVSSDFQDNTTSYWEASVPLPSESGGPVYSGGTFTFQIVWTSTASSGTAAWKARSRYVCDDDATDQAYGTAIEVTDAVTANEDYQVTSYSSAMTPAGSYSAGCDLALQVYREAFDTDDTLAGDQRLLRVHLKYGLTP